MGYLSEVARRRIAAMLLVASAVVVALAIADVGPFSDPPTQEERAQDTVERFFDAVRGKDFDVACDELTLAARRTVAQQAGRLVAASGAKGCDEILRVFLGGRPGQTRIARFTDVSVSGNKARIEAELQGSGSSQTRPTTIQLFEVGDNWKISDFGT
jgi:hypothetical protein